MKRTIVYLIRNSETLKIDDIKNIEDNLKSPSIIKLYFRGKDLENLELLV